MSSVVQTILTFLRTKIVKRTAIAIAALVVGAFVSLYAASEWRLARTYDAPAITLRTGHSASASRGERWAKIFGCQGCHGANGQPLIDRPVFGVLIAPNLTRVAREYSDRELAVVIRTGIKRDGTSALAMPSDAFSSMADEDVADIIAWMRTLAPVADAEPSRTSWGPVGRFVMFAGRFPFSAELPRDAAPPATHPVGTPMAEGEYLYKAVCGHCHRLDEEHLVRPGLIAPAMRPVTAGYDLAQFTHLMRTGKPIGDRKLELMSEVSTGSLSHLTDAEIGAIHAYLTATDGTPEPASATTAN